MKYEFKNSKLGSIFGVSNHLQADESAFVVQEDLVKLLWNRNKVPVEIQVDDLVIHLEPSQIMTTQGRLHTTHIKFPFACFLGTICLLINSVLF